MADFTWVGPTISGAAAVLGGATVAVTNYLMVNLQTKNQRNVEREKYEREIDQLRFEAYNKILKADGETGVVQMNRSTLREIVDNKKYRKLIRPFVYERFHLLDEEIRQTARELDLAIEQIDFSEKIDRLPSE